MSYRLICTLTRLSKQQYYSKFFNDNLTNMKKTLEGINNLLARKLNNTNLLLLLKTLMSMILSPVTQVEYSQRS